VTIHADGRSLTQGALAWIWVRSPQTIPIPGFRTVKQVEENVAALRFGALAEDEMREIAKVACGVMGGRIGVTP
jgi:aryl-alcohol dehydrogenase-like predicted oxidoreductase